MRYSIPFVCACAALAVAGAAPAIAQDVPAGFQPLFNGHDLSGWKVLDGKQSEWGAEDGLLFVRGGGGGWLMTEKEYGDFEIRLEFKLPRHGNSGVALRAPMRGNPAYDGMEIQILDDRNYDNLRPAQHAGSIYDVVPPSRDVTRPYGSWNTMHITARGRKITVELNGTVIVDADLDQHKDRIDKHPGLVRTRGHLGLQSEDGRVEFRNLYVKEL
jgi:hypothetical protein